MLLNSVFSHWGVATLLYCTKTLRESVIQGTECLTDVQFVAEGEQDDVDQVRRLTGKVTVCGEVASRTCDSDCWRDVAAA